MIKKLKVEVRRTGCCGFRLIQVDGFGSINDIITSFRENNYSGYGLLRFSIENKKVFDELIKTYPQNHIILPRTKVKDKTIYNVVIRGRNLLHRKIIK